MKVGIIQLDIVWNDVEKNFSRVAKLIRQAKTLGAEFVCLPELFSTGVTMESSKFAETEAGGTCRFLSEQAKANEVCLLGSFIEKIGQELPKNAVVLYDAKGLKIGAYHKNHVFTYGQEDKAYSNGEGIAVVKIRDFHLAPFICYDLRFPEIFRIAVDHGADVFVIPANWPNPRKEQWLTLLKARAIENQSYVIGVNRVGNSPDLTFFGHSAIISPQGEFIVQGGEREDILIGELRLDEVADWRKKFTALRDRRKNYYFKPSVK